MRYRMLAAAFIALCGVTVNRATAAETTGKTIDVAILLDTSNSMDGLIESAKSKLWTIVNDLAKIEPTPTLRVALYQYGNDALDRGNGWVRRELELSNDLDEVYKKLNALKTYGGTEYVTRVTRDALNELKWSDEKDALRLIFVCGNEPANQDKTISLESVAEVAKKKGVFVNTIYCGRANHPEANLWKDFATMAGGKYMSIDQDRVRTQVVIKTPQDEELLKLNDKLNSTYVSYGGKGGEEKQINQRLQDSNAAKAAPGAALDRLGTKVGALYRNDAWDLVDRMKNDPKFDIKTLKEEELCDELKKMKPEERVEYVKKKAAERDALRKQIEELNAKRSAYIQEEMKKQPRSAGDKAFDEAVRTTIREQANTKGIKIPE
jgi:von Willebrand factor type A domain